MVTVADLEIYRGSATGAQSAPENVWVATPTSGVGGFSDPLDSVTPVS